MKPSVVALLVLSTPSNCSPLEVVLGQVFTSVQRVFGFGGQNVTASWKPTALQKDFSSVKDSCNNLELGAFDPVTWSISTSTFCPNRFSTAPYVANGYFGQALPSESTGFWIEKRADGSVASNGKLIACF
jgi:hypothetical protein